MNETKHIIYESLFIYNTSAIHQLHSIATYIYVTLKEGFKPQALPTAEPSQVRRFELGNCKASAAELPPSYGLARYAKT